jgi:hypothetical protein
MRRKFDTAAKIVKTAVDLGLNAHTDTAALLDTGAPEEIAAYRALPAAVAELNGIAGLRNQLTTVARVGPTNYPVAAFIASAESGLDLEGAANAWSGQTEVVQANVGLLGTHLARVRAKRLGGSWLALINAGFKLRLNSGGEAEAVVRDARTGGDR